MFLTEMPHVPLFPTPLSMYEFPDLKDVNREITDRLVAESRSTKTVHRSNVGGWHSPTDLQYRTEPCFRVLLDRIVASVRESATVLANELGTKLPPLGHRVQAWAMVMRDGNYTIPHDHAEVHWGTVYYADAGDADLKVHQDSGMIAFIDPRHGSRPMPGLDLVGGTFLAQPATGRLYVFPGWLMHYVHPYRGTRPRVSISCNVTFEVATTAAVATAR